MKSRVIAAAAALCFSIISSSAHAYHLVFKNDSKYPILIAFTTTDSKICKPLPKQMIKESNPGQTFNALLTTATYLNYFVEPINLRPYAFTDPDDIFTKAYKAIHDQILKIQKIESYFKSPHYTYIPVLPGDAVTSDTAKKFTGAYGGIKYQAFQTEILSDCDKDTQIMIHWRCLDGAVRPAGPGNHWTERLWQSHNDKKPGVVYASKHIPHYNEYVEKHCPGTQKIKRVRRY